MVNVSTVRKLSIAARIAAQHAGRTRTVGAILKGARTTAAHFGRVLHQLWLEVTGFVFLALAFIGGGALFSGLALFPPAQNPPVRLAAAIFFYLTFSPFGAHFFFRGLEKEY